MNILQQSTNTNTQERRDIIILRKPPILTQQNDEILLTNTAKKRAKADKNNKYVQKPPPLAVARRNARERNRVKQVNNGFATLRQHIPNSIAAAFESNPGRGGNKKLSKVETLRMAVEYIRSLEDILAADGCDIPTSSNISPNQSYTFQMTSPLSMDDDELSTNPTPPPQQYIKINNSYQLLPSIYEDPNSINMNGNILADEIIMSENTVFNDLSLLNSIQTNASLSPEVYSDNSLSPNSMGKHERYMYEPSPVDVKIKVEQPFEMEDVPEEHKENMLHVMAWWEQQQGQAQNS